MFTDEQMRVLKRVFASNTFQGLIGAEQWDLTEDEEMILWGIIKATVAVKRGKRVGKREARELY